MNKQQQVPQLYTPPTSRVDKTYNTPSTGNATPVYEHYGHPHVTYSVPMNPVQKIPRQLYSFPFHHHTRITQQSTYPTPYLPLLLSPESSLSTQQTAQVDKYDPEFYSIDR